MLELGATRVPAQGISPPQFALGIRDGELMTWQGTSPHSQTPLEQQLELGDGVTET